MDKQGLKKRLSDAERRYDDRYEDFARAAADWWFWEMDSDLRFTYLSENSAPNTGRPVADIVGKQRCELTANQTPEEAAAWRRHMDDLSHHRPFQQFEYRIITAEGQHRWISISGVPVFDEKGEFQGYRGTGNNISRRKETEIRLHDSEHKFRLLAENSSEWIYSIGDDPGLSYHSPACLDITGYSAEELVAEPTLISTIVHPSDREKFIDHTKSEGQERLQMTFRIIRRDGKERWIDHVCQPLLDEDGSVLGRKVTNRDITEAQTSALELKRYRNHLEELVTERTTELAAANKAKSIFLANMSHEIRTPMNAILGLTHLALRHSQDTREKELLRKVTTSAEHLLAVINNILDIAMIESARLTVEKNDFAPTQLISNLINIIADRATQKGLILQRCIPENLPAVLKGDPDHLRQVLVHLANNAVKFTERGTITISVGWQPDSAATGQLRFDIEDTGIGISDEACRRLFQVFEQADSSATRRYGGAGLGLAISRQLVRMMGGDIGVDSVEGRGSHFWFTVKVAVGGAVMPDMHEPTADEAAVFERQLQQQCFGRRVLLAEDNPMNQDVVRELLRDTGLQLDVAVNGAEAVTAAQGKMYDLVLMDIQMPVMDGLSATRALRQLPGWSSIPILALTANAFTEDRINCQKAGMNAFLVKPVVPAVFFKALLNWLPKISPIPANIPPPSAEQVCPRPLAPPATEDELRAVLKNVPHLNVDQGLLSVRNRIGTYARLLSKFIETHDSDMNQIKEQLQMENFDEARRLAHSLKGVSATMGAVEVQARAYTLEMAIKERQDSATIQNAIHAVEAEWTLLAQSIRNVLPASPAQS